MSIIENSMACIAIIIEDSVDLFENEAYQKNFEQLLQPISNQLLLHRPESVKANAINSINMLMISMINVLNDQLENYLLKLLELSQDPSKLIQERCLQGIANISDFRIDLILKHSQQTYSVLIQSLQLYDQKVALAAAEFWSGLMQNKVEDQDLEMVRLQGIQNILPQLLPLLMNCCKFSAIDLMNINQQSKDDDMNIYTGKYYSYSNNDGSEDIEDEEGQTDGMSTLRRASAYAIDCISKVAPDLVFPILKPTMEGYLQNNENVHEKECAILVLGAISDPDGAYNSIISHLTNLVPFLIQELKNSSSLIRTTTCWTLSKFSYWIGEQNEEIFKSYLSELLKRFMDSDCNVQESACSAFSNLLMSSPNRVQPYIQDVVQVLGMIFDQYQGNSLLSLYDCIGCLCENMSENIKEESVINKILPPLMNKWNKTDDFDRALCPLFECFETIANSLGEVFESYSPPVIERCLRIISQVLQIQSESDITQDISMQKELLIRCLVLLRKVLRSLSGKASQQINIQTFLQILLDCAQYTFALVGVLPEIFTSEQIGSVVPQLVEIMVKHLGKDWIQTKVKFSVCNNAVWAIGVYSTHYPEIVEEMTDQIMTLITEQLTNQKISTALAQNSSITLGKLGLIQPQLVSHYLPQIMKNWCTSLRYLKNSKEKQQAFEGMCKMIPINPAGVQNNFPFLCDALCEYKDASEELEQQFKHILHSFKQSLGQQWGQYFNSFPQKMKQVMETRFQL